MVKIKTDKIKNIKLESSETWKDNVFITLDLDWAIDEVIQYSVDYKYKNQIGHASLR
tara:strand:- start:387 stop:557 length:171 start_codon:yes stop_codon:yes gene_type:complete